MTTIHQLRNIIDTDNKARLIILLPWDQTSLARIYDYFDNNYERGCLFDVLSYEPLEFYVSNKTMEIDVIIDVSDALEEEEY